MLHLRWPWADLSPGRAVTADVWRLRASNRSVPAVHSHDPCASNGTCTAAAAQPSRSPTGLLTSAASFLLLALALALPCRSAATDSAPTARPAPGTGAVSVRGEQRQWHSIVLTLDGPFADELDEEPNPFTDLRFTVAFRHDAGPRAWRVPGYFAADGDAANSSARRGTKWQARFVPDIPGTWAYRIEFVSGPRAALNPEAPSAPVAPYHGLEGTFEVAPTDKTGRDFRAHGRLEYVGEHHLRFAGSGEFFLKVGADAPESLLAYEDFDGTASRLPPNAAAREGEAAPGTLHRYAPHLPDWRPGDPTWKDGRGKGLLGALNYLAGAGANAVSFLTYNVGGDGDNVWPFVHPTNKFHFDVSKLDQWRIVFDHAQSLGLYLHFKLQETEMDDHRHQGKDVVVPSALDGGDLGPERQLYLRELVARFGHALALNWNLGEENTQSSEQQRAMARYLKALDPYAHPIVLHTYPDWQDRVYTPLLGDRSDLTGLSLQNGWAQVHQRTHQWVRASAAAGKPWVVANDEQNPAGLGVPPDPGYEGFSGEAREGSAPAYTLHDIRKYTLWGNLLAGGAGVEYYFGYTLPQNDLRCEDWRSRHRSWTYGRIALDFVREQRIPFWLMTNADERVGNPDHDNRRYAMVAPDGTTLVYLPTGGTTTLDLGTDPRAFHVAWFDPRNGGPLQSGSVGTIRGPGAAVLGTAPNDPSQDWVVLVRPGPTTAR